MSALLEREMQTYEEHKAELVTSSPGKFALIKDDAVFDILDSQADAIRLGYERFGNVPFLVKEIVEVETPLNFTSYMLGL